MSFQSIRQEIKDVIDAQSTLVQETYLTDTSEIDGFPAVVITPSELDSDYGSTQRDKWIFVYTLSIYYPIKDLSVQEKVDLRLEKVIDELLNIFKTRNVLGSVCDWVEPAPSSWGKTTNTETVYRMATITLRCVQHVANV